MRKKSGTIALCVVFLSLSVFLSAQLRLPVRDYLRLQNPEAWKRGELPTTATGSKAMIASTSEPSAIHAGLEALRHGGSAAGAALTTSLAQIALSTGAAYSYAGVMAVVYYDASSRKIYTLNAGYNTVTGETDLSRFLRKSQWPHSACPRVHGRRTGTTRPFRQATVQETFRTGNIDPADGVPFNPEVEVWLKAAGPFVKRLPDSKKIIVPICAQPRWQ